MRDKYGTGQDPYCYPGMNLLRNRLGLKDEQILEHAERGLSELAADSIEFGLPPYDLHYLSNIHRQLFSDIYEWAGQLRTIDISKGNTLFCTVSRIRPEAERLFESLANANWFQGLARGDLIIAGAEMFGDLNMIHPFRDGNGRAQRILFEHLIINAGFQIDWWGVDIDQWAQANINSVVCDYRAMQAVFEQCIGEAIG